MAPRTALSASRFCGGSLNAVGSEGSGKPRGFIGGLRAWLAGRAPPRRGCPRRRRALVRPARRSEERRVGKESRSRGWRAHETKRRLRGGVAGDRQGGHGAADEGERVGGRLMAHLRL